MTWTLIGIILKEKELLNDEIMGIMGVYVSWNELQDMINSTDEDDKDMKYLSQDSEMSADEDLFHKKEESEDDLDINWDYLTVESPPTSCVKVPLSKRRRKML